MPEDVATSTADPIRVGGRYVLGPELGRGGMARVHRAHDEVLGRDVAVKVLHPHLAADETFLARFRREARAAAALAHPNVVGVHDWGETSDGAYLVMQLIDGVSLRDVLRRRGVLTPAEALAVLAPAAAGLGAAHAAGIVHRDVKPENLLIGRDGVVRVTDFGLARAAASASTTFGADVLVGSPHYLAPEAVQGGSLDARADVYALGIVLVECLTGAPPHDADSPFTTAMQHTLRPVPLPSILRPELTDVLDDVVATATAMDRTSRYDDANAFGSALTRMLGGAVDRVEPPDGTGERSVETPGSPDGEARSASDIDEPAGSATARLPRRDPDAETQLVAPTTQVARRGRPAPAPSPADLDIAADVAADPAPNAAATDPAATDPTATDPTATDPTATDPTATKATDEAVNARRPSAGPPPPPALATSRADAPASADPTRPRRRRGRAGLVVVLIVLLLGGSAAGGYLVWDRVLAPVTAIPDVIGAPLEDADAALSTAGFEVEVEQDRPFDLGTPAGHVLEQRPSGELRAGGVVTVVLSAGPRPVDVPDLVGEDEAEVIALLDELGLRPERSERHDEVMEAGLVLETLPGADATIDEGSVVEVVVSLGPTPIEVPEVTGIAEADALSTLEQSDLRGEVVDRRFSPRPAGEVLEQQPAAGATRIADDVVELIVSEGPEPVEVPGVRGERTDDAVATLEALGFDVEVDRRGGFGALLNPDRVYDQDPAPGAARLPGDTVVVYAYN